MSAVMKTRKSIVEVHVEQLCQLRRPAPDGLPTRSKCSARNCPTIKMKDSDQPEKPFHQSRASGTARNSRPWSHRQRHRT
eukprot:8630696-Alexandrium_andersonii.AAC.1